jgi:hypothetical protein
VVHRRASASIWRKIAKKWPWTEAAGAFCTTRSIGGSAPAGLLDSRDDQAACLTVGAARFASARAICTRVAVMIPSAEHLARFPHAVRADLQPIGRVVETYPLSGNLPGVLESSGDICDEHQTLTGHQ